MKWAREFTAAAATSASRGSTRAPNGPVSPPVPPVMVVSHFGKRYNKTVAVDDVSLDVLEGEICGLIGPNGAGKTTTMECVQGHRVPDAGAISVLGLDPRRDADALRQRIGVQHQEAQLQKRIKGVGSSRH